MPTAAKYAKETFWALAAKAAAFIFYYALLFYLTRRMTVDAWGNWSAFVALLNIILLTSDQGVNVASKRYIAQARNDESLPEVIRSTFVLRLLASLAYTAAIAALLYPLLRLLHQESLIGLMQRSLLLVALYGVLEYFKNLFEALHRLRFTFLVNFIEHGAKFALVLLLFRGGDDFVAIVTAFTIAVGLAAVAGVLFAAGTIPGILKMAVAWPLARRTYLYSLPVFLMSIGGFIALEIDTIMLKNMSDAYQTGVYSAAKSIVIYLPHLSLAFSMGIIPGLAVFDAESAAVNRRFFHRTLRAISGIYLLISGGVVAFAFFGVGIFFKPEYHAASTPLLFLTPFVILSGVSGYCGNLLDYRGLAWIRSLNFGVTIILNVLLNLWWIPKWGAVGAAASSIAFLPYCALNLWQADRAFTVDAVSKK